MNSKKLDTYVESQFVSSISLHSIIIYLWYEKRPIKQNAIIKIQSIISTFTFQ